MKTQYTPEYFMQQFEAIPEELWITGGFTDKTGKLHCAAGHCGARFETGEGEIRTPESAALADMFDEKLDLGVATVNDYKVRTYTQPTPKQRILAALRDIAEMEKK